MNTMEIQTSSSNHNILILSKEHSLKKFNEESLFRESYQSLFVIADSFYSVVLAIFHKAIECLSFIFDQKDSKSVHQQIADYYIIRLGSRYDARIVLTGSSSKERSCLINFSLNTSGTPSLQKESTKQQLNQVKELYGNDFERLSKKLKAKNIKIERKNLYLPLNQGICLGANLDFVKKFFKAKSKKKPAIQAIQEISCDYIYGAPKRAQILQIISSCIENAIPDHVQETKVKEFEEKCIKPYEEFKEKLLKELSDKELADLSEQKFQKLLKKQEKRLKEKEITLTSKAFKKISQLMNRHYINPTGSLVNLQSKAKSTIATYIEDIETKSYSGFKKLFSKLKENGAYTLALTFENDDEQVCNHAILYIKESDQEHYLFDPNYGTRICSSLEEIFNTLGRLMTHSKTSSWNENAAILTGFQWIETSSV